MSYFAVFGGLHERVSPILKKILESIFIFGFFCLFFNKDWKFFCSILLNIFHNFVFFLLLFFSFQTQQIGQNLQIYFHSLNKGDSTWFFIENSEDSSSSEIHLSTGMSENVTTSRNSKVTEDIVPAKTRLVEFFFFECNKILPKNF